MMNSSSIRAILALGLLTLACGPASPTNGAVSGAGGAAPAAGATSPTGGSADSGGGSASNGGATTALASTPLTEAGLFIGNAAVISTMDWVELPTTGTVVTFLRFTAAGHTFIKATQNKAEYLAAQDTANITSQGTYAVVGQALQLTPGGSSSGTLLTNGSQFLELDTNGIISDWTQGTHVTSYYSSTTVGVGVLSACLYASHCNAGEECRSGVCEPGSTASGGDGGASGGSSGGGHHSGS